MEISLVEVWAQMGLAAKFVVITLSVMAVASITVVIERLLALRRWNADARRFAGRAAEAIQGRQYASLITEIGDGRSPVPRLVRAGLKSYVDALKQPARDVSAVELARRELGRTLENIAADCRRGMNVLASVSSVAPFVGLFGTVVGIIAAFEGIAKTGSGGLGSVAAGIAEALIVTGLGLGVAIPAVLLFNLLS